MCIFFVFENVSTNFSYEKVITIEPGIYIPHNFQEAPEWYVIVVVNLLCFNFYGMICLLFQNII